MKKLFSLFLVFMLLVTVIPFNALADTDSAGITVGYDLGKNFQITYDKTSKTLTVQGKGCFGKLGFSEFDYYYGGNPMCWDWKEDCFPPLYHVENIVIGEGITAIGDYMFINFYKAKKITLPKSLKRIGKASFLNCLHLQKIIGGQNVTQIDGGAFLSCSDIKNISFPNLVKIDNSRVHVFSTMDEIDMDDGYYWKLDKSFSVGPFVHCRNLESIYIPKVKKLADRTFFDCPKLKTINKNNNLNNITDMGVSVFYNCKSLKNISLPKIKAVKSSALIKKGDDGGIILPSGDLHCEGAFENCSSLEKINIPNVEVIGNNSFYNCKNLKSINKNNSLSKLTYLGLGVFAKCEKLEKISLPKVQQLKMTKYKASDLRFYNEQPDDFYYECVSDLRSCDRVYGTFEGCTRLKSISAPNVKTVGARTFYSCKSLKKISLPKVTTLGSSAFFNCINLTSVNMPKLRNLQTTKWTQFKLLNEGTEDFPIKVKRKYYYRGTFEKCVKLKKITSSSLANVGKYDFKDCTRLESITLGKNLKSIGDSAFNNNRKLKSVNIKSTKLSKVGKSAFSKIYSKAKFTVPKSKLKKYKKLIKSNGKAPKNVKFIAK